MVDTNCPWTAEEARHNARRLMAYDMFWLEEPIFPPEDFLSLARLRREEGVALAAGENARTAMEFAQMLRATSQTRSSRFAGLRDSKTARPEGLR